MARKRRKHGKRVRLGDRIARLIHAFWYYLVLPFDVLHALVFNRRTRRLSRAIGYYVSLPFDVLNALVFNRRTERLVHATGYYLSLPFHFVFDSFHKLGNVVWRYFSRPLEAVAELSRVVWYCLSFPFDVVWTFMFHWLRTRPWLSLVAGLPAMLCGMGFLAIDHWHARTSSADWAGKYEQEGNAALGRGDFEAADVYFRRSVLLGGDAVATRYGLAMTAQQQGDLRRARSLMLQLAPETEPGDARAHYWLAMSLMEQQTTLSPEEFDVLEHHLVQAQRLGSQALESQASLAWVYEMRGEIGPAIKQLERVVSERPALNLSLARLYAQTGQLGNARRAAARASRYFQGRIPKEGGETVDRLLWATSLAMQQRHDEAVEVLTVGLRGDDPQPFHNALAALYFQRFNIVARSARPDLAQQLELLERVLAHDPNHQEALRILCNVAVMPDDFTDQAVAMLNQMVARGDAPPYVHMALGVRAIHRGESELGLGHLWQTLPHNPYLPAQFNNIAWALAHQDQPDLKLALSLAEAAVKLYEHPEFHHTFGTILGKAGRAEEAVEQLQIALRDLPPRAEIHEKLADLYHQLGSADLAATHRRQAEELDATGQISPK